MPSRVGWFIILAAAALGLALVLRLIGVWGRPAGNNPTVDSAIVSTPAVAETTRTVIRDSDTTLARVARLEDSVRRLTRRARLRGDSLTELKRELAAARTPQDTIDNLTRQVATCEAQAADHAAATTTCQAGLDSAKLATGRLRARLTRVQARADSIPIFVKLAVAAAPCRRDWGLFHVSCTLHDVVVGGLSFTAGAATN